MRFPARDLNSSELSSLGALPYSGMQVIDLGSGNYQSGSHVYVQNRQVGFAFDLSGLPARDTVQSIKTLNLHLETSREGDANLDGQLLCFLGQGVCSGQTDSSEASSVNSSFFHSYSLANSYFAQQELDHYHRSGDSCCTSDSDSCDGDNDGHDRLEINGARLDLESLLASSSFDLAEYCQVTSSPGKSCGGSHGHDGDGCGYSGGGDHKNHGGAWCENHRIYYGALDLPISELVANSNLEPLTLVYGSAAASRADAANTVEVLVADDLMISQRSWIDVDFTTQSCVSPEPSPSPSSSASPAPSTSPSPSVDLSIAETVDNATPFVGANVNFTVTLTNPGPTTASTISVANVLPSGFTFVSASATSGTYASGVWALADFAQQSASLTITATVLGSGDYTDTSTITASTPEDSNPNNSASATVTPVVPYADLAVTKTVSNATPLVGANVTFTVTVTNNGPQAATGVSVADALPSGYTLVSATASSGTYASGVWNIGTMADGAHATLSVVATVLGSGNYTNTATASDSSPADPNSNNNTASATVTPVVPTTSLTIAKTVSNATPLVGSNVTFTVTVANQGAQAATNVSVSDALPSGYTLVSATPSAGSYAGGVWSIPSLAGGANATLSVVATVLSTGNYTNTATITASTPSDSNTQNSASASTTPVQQEASLAITKTVNNTTPTVGSNVVFTVTVTNNGPQAATGVSVNDVLPSGYTLVSNAPSVGSYTGSVWMIGNLADGASATLSVTATVLSSGNYTNTATVSDTSPNNPNSANNTASASTSPVQPKTSLAITKTVSNTTPLVGSNVTFTVTVTNSGPQAATSISVADSLPGGYTLVSATPSTGSYASGVWSIPGLADGANTTLSVVATVLASGNYTNTATITASTPTDSNTQTSASASTTPVQQEASLAITKTVNNATPLVGSNVIFTVTVTNNGPQAATGVSVNDTLPSGYTLVSSTPSVGSYTGSVWMIGNLVNGASATLAVTATVNASGNYTNTATVSDTSPNNPNSANNTASASTTPVQQQADLAITKSVNNTTPIIGSNVVFTLTVKNNGPQAATGVSVNDVLPSGYTFVSSAPSTGSYSGSVWMIGNLADGAQATLAVTATVLGSGNYTNTATVSAVSPSDPNSSNNTASASTTPAQPQAALAISKTVNNSTPFVGSSVTFTVTVSNNGPQAATGVSVADPLPSGYTLVSSAPSVGSYNSANGNWTIGNLADGASATLTIVATVNASGGYTNTATVTSTSQDTNPANSASASTTPVVPTASLAITKTVDNSTPLVGANVNFTVTVTDNGPQAATSITVSDPVPTGYTLVSTTPSAGTYANGQWSIPSLADGASATLVMTATVNASGNYTNTAIVTGSTPSNPNSGNDTASASTTPVQPEASLVIMKSVNNATPTVNTNVVFTVNVTNNGPQAATGVSVNDLLPSGYSLVSTSTTVGSYSGGVWMIGNMADGATATLTMTATVLASGNYTNTATVSDVSPTNPNAAHNTASASTTPVQEASLSITKSVNDNTPLMGTNVNFTVTVTNDGPSAASAISVSDPLPSGYTLVSSAASVGTYSGGTWTIPALADGSSATLTVTATVNSSGNYTNVATITASTPNNPNSANNTASASTSPVAPEAGLSITNTANNLTPDVGSNVVLTVSVTNSGPQAAAGVSVADLLPSGLTFVSAAPSTGSYNSSTGTWAIGSLADSASASLQITATVLASGSYTDTATVTETTSDPNNNNSATVTLSPIFPTADLAVTMSVDNMSPDSGSAATFTITVTNNGPNNAVGATLNDLLPSGLFYVSATPSTGSYNSSTGVWAIGNLNAGASVTLTLVGDVLQTGSYTNTATVTDTSPTDPNLSNNSSSITLTPVITIIGV